MGTFQGCAPYAAMIVVQLAYGGLNILGKLALQKGLSYLAFIVYGHLIAMIILGPLAYVLERKQRTSLSFLTLMKIFLLAGLGTTTHQMLCFVGLNYTSPTVAGAMSNVIPGLTFLLAILLRMEKLQIGSLHGRAKVIETVICMSGALIFTLWKGYQFKGIVSSPLITMHNKGSSRHAKDDWIKGSAFILTGNVAWSAWLILQALVYELLTTIYCGTITSALVYYLHTWCISKKGPVFSSMFSPLVLVITAIFSAIVFAERIHFGSLIGAFLIIIGLYCVLWARAGIVMLSMIRQNKQTKYLCMMKQYKFLQALDDNEGS